MSWSLPIMLSAEMSFSIVKISEIGFIGSDKKV